MAFFSGGGGGGGGSIGGGIKGGVGGVSLGATPLCSYARATHSA